MRASTTAVGLESYVPRRYNMSLHDMSIIAGRYVWCDVGRYGMMYDMTSHDMIKRVRDRAPTAVVLQQYLLVKDGQHVQYSTRAGSLNGGTFVFGQ